MSIRRSYREVILNRTSTQPGCGQQYVSMCFYAGPVQYAPDATKMKLEYSSWMYSWLRGDGPCGVIHWPETKLMWLTALS